MFGEIGDEVTEALALDDDMRLEEGGGGLRIAALDGREDVVVLGEGGADAPPDAELEAPVGLEATVHQRRLLGEEAVAGGLVDGVMKALVGIVIAVRVIGLGGGAAIPLGGRHRGQIGTVGPAGGEAAASHI